MAGRAGGISTVGDVTLTNTLIQGNSATYGGGIFSAVSEDDPQITATGCVISANVATQSGGGIYNDAAAITLTSCTIAGNQAGPFGGGIEQERFNDSTEGSCSLLNVTVVDNHAGEGGGLQPLCRRIGQSDKHADRSEQSQQH